MPKKWIWYIKFQLRYFVQCKTKIKQQRTTLTTDCVMSRRTGKISAWVSRQLSIEFAVGFYFGFYIERSNKAKILCIKFVFFGFWLIFFLFTIWLRSNGKNDCVIFIMIFLEAIKYITHWKVIESEYVLCCVFHVFVVKKRTKSNIYILLSIFFHKKVPNFWK